MHSDTNPDGFRGKHLGKINYFLGMAIDQHADYSIWFCLLCVWGGSSRGAVLAVPSVVPVLVLQDSTLYRLQVV